METGFLNSHDGDHLSVMSHLYDQSMLEESDSLLDMMQDELSFSSLSNSHFIGNHGFWDHDSTSNGTDAVLPLPFGEDSPHSDVGIKEDFQKMLSEWQEHLGTLQSSDSEEIDVKDLVEMDISMSKNSSEEMPSDIFEDSCEMKTVLSVEKLHLPTKDRTFNGLSLNFSENLNSFNLENFLEDDDEEEHKFGLIVAEEEEHTSGSKLSLNKSQSNNLKIQDIPLTESTINNFNSKETEEEAVDVETVSDQIPVLEAGDLKSLLEQFEASEAFNCIVGNSKDSSEEQVINSEEGTPVPKTQPLAKKRLLSAADLPVSTAVVSSTTTAVINSTTSTSTNTGTGEANGTTLHETIRDSLPQEVIDRIKASNRRKAIPVIPAMPSRRPGRGATRMQVAAATLSRNKLLKLVSNGGKGGESIQLDHDYCSSTASTAAEVPPPKSFYHSNASEYVSEQKEPSSSGSKNAEESCAKPVLGENKVYSRLPEYYVVLAPQKALDKNRKGGSVKEEVWDKNSRKDSGLESGEVSDASEETIITPVTAVSRDVISGTVKSEERKCLKSIVPSCTDNGAVTFDVQNKTEISDRKKPASILRSDSGNSVLKDWSAVRQDNCLSKPVAMVSVLKKNNVGCVTNTPIRQQSLLVSSNNSGRNCNASSNSVSTNTNSNSISSNANSCSSAAVTQSLVETEKVKSEGPKKKKLNLEEYRSRLKELDRSRMKEESTSTCPSSISGSSTVKSEELQSGTKDTLKDGKQSEVLSSSCPPTGSEKTLRPQMHSVEVQTQTSIFDEVPDDSNEKSKDLRSRKKQRKYCSKRASSSSSSHSTSSGSSRRHRKSRSQMRRRTSRRRSQGHSVSSSGSQRPRSRSNSSQSSSSYSSYSSRSRSHSRSRSRSHSSARRSPSCSRPRSSFQARFGYRRPLPYSTNWRSRSRSPSYGPRKNDWMLTEREKQRQVEERRVIYVGRIDEGTSKAELRRRFESFGPIVDISVHFREHGDNYGFVTFAYKVDAYEAVEHGNDDPNLPRYDLCFGGRRAFCKTRYADLDGIATSDGPASSGYIRGGYSRRTDSQAEDFDLLLREAQAKLRKRKV